MSSYDIFYKLLFDDADVNGGWLKKTVYGNLESYDLDRRQSIDRLRLFDDNSAPICFDLAALHFSYYFPLKLRCRTFASLDRRFGGI
ncbi:ATP-dependent helicase/deoxyribonuclease subunit [Trichinella spiralis]|uniref:ATP-dependent helicase/deoxyribonuclease subunit n=1 Tax=Trichinella spiralis TaxID=6334 RepID=A0ABR3KI29_TRISP